MDDNCCIWCQSVLAIYLSDETEAGFVFDTSEGCYRCKSELCDCHATKELCQMADFNTICCKLRLHSYTTVTHLLAALCGLYAKIHQTSLSVGFRSPSKAS